MRELITIHPDGRVVRETFNKVSLKMLQQRVGGYIERVPSQRRFENRPGECWCNEEGLLKGMERNHPAQQVFGCGLVGPVVINRVYKEPTP